MSNQGPSESKDEFLNKYLTVQAAEKENQRLEIESNKEIRFKEMETAIALEKIETEKLSIHFTAYNETQKRKYKIVTGMCLVGAGVLIFSCFLLYVNHPFGITIFSSALSMVAGIFGGVGIKSFLSSVGDESDSSN
ncbi:hypothetical protein CH354_10125 [Leptospira levettii]|uniref:hypothetical protein n=1 Tax=Leptospira levettii TaxID=2023178 RepID=UPI000C2B3BD3|nr:hypothetical protein [Leptospira levettii]PJZ37408.1 hypothetical protein CH354_10125 [Leptospira levettii]